MVLLGKLRQVSEHLVPKDLGAEWQATTMVLLQDSTAAVWLDISHADLFPIIQDPSSGI